MIVVDVIVVLLLVGALVAGIQRGFFASIGTLAGLAAGAVAAFWLTPLVSAWVPSPVWRGPAVLLTAIGLVFGGAALGAAIGGALRSGADRLKLRGLERFLGGIASVVAAILALALVTPAIAVAGIPVISSAVASSSLLRGIEAATPDPVAAALAELRGAVLDDGLPGLGVLLGPGTAEPAPPVALDDPDLQRAAASVARVSGNAYACGRGSSGTGFVIAEDRVVTNAHVVAGVDTPIVELPGVAAREGRIVYFDPVDDLAVIAVDDLGAAALPVSPTLAAGEAAVVQGYPYGGPFTMVSAGVTSVGTATVPDVYDDSWNPREIYALQATVRPGNSGGPLLTGDGEVAGVVFARAEDDENLGYAMTMAELTPVAERAPSLGDTVSSGACVA
ncbi:MarP family serine protease [Microbacterium sp. M3]|uniref:MarP family serine protease n=1 Tax=Microbacterium arthrosphaerae TaxID=792652 RepID=A0ABU4GZX6_9MICO|nr:MULTISPECIES: MarP family serine protease [Microbacterium]MDW4571174.1 MarP family serine protease [Microbacterium arthrosphaerae]MDW7605029.1 MarP family serine protease [Microbacterium sp. M3]